MTQKLPCFLLAVLQIQYSLSYDIDMERMGLPLPTKLTSIGGGEEEDPPVYRPESQMTIVSQLLQQKPAHQVWEELTSPSVPAEQKNCMLCETVDSGMCNMVPSCIFCEATVTARCERSIPCLRCTVMKNPFFKCVIGEKYMDECDSCRCMDGHYGWCTNQYCEYRALYIYAMKLSEGELY